MLNTKTKKSVRLKKRKHQKADRKIIQGVKESRVDYGKENYYKGTAGDVMKKFHDENLILIIRKYFKDKPVLKAYLFGSSLRKGKANDIDILVELDYTQKIGLKFVQMQLELERILHQKIDLLSREGLSKYVKPYIERDKVLIYER